MLKFPLRVFEILQVGLILLVCLIGMALAVPGSHKKRNRNRNRGITLS